MNRLSPLFLVLLDHNVLTILVYEWYIRLMGNRREHGSLAEFRAASESAVRRVGTAPKRKREMTTDRLEIHK